MVECVLIMLLLLMSSRSVATRTSPEIFEIVLVGDGLAPILQGDGLWDPSDRENAPVGLTPNEMRDSKALEPLPSFLPTSEDFIILDPSITTVRLKSMDDGGQRFIKGWTILVFNPNPSFLPPRLTKTGKVNPQNSVYWNEVMTLVNDDTSTMWANITWSTSNVNQSLLITPRLDEIFPYWRDDLFTYLYVVELLHFFDSLNEVEIVTGTIYMYQLIFRKSTPRDVFWLYSPDYSKSWWLFFYLVVNLMIVVVFVSVILRYKKTIDSLRSNL